MKDEIKDSLKRLGFKLYPKGGKPQKYLVYLHGKAFNDEMTERQLVSLAKTMNKPLTKPRLTCKTPRPGCPCCDKGRSIVKELDKKANRRANKKETNLCSEDEDALRQEVQDYLNGYGKYMRE
jgi:hypothetical protein